MKLRVRDKVERNKGKQDGAGEPYQVLSHTMHDIRHLEGHHTARVVWN